MYGQSNCFCINSIVTFLKLFYQLIIKIVKYVLFIMYLEFVDNSIANIGAIFQGKSARGNMECVQYMREVEVML